MKINNMIQLCISAFTLISLLVSCGKKETNKRSNIIPTEEIVMNHHDEEKSEDATVDVDDKGNEIEIPTVETKPLNDDAFIRLAEVDVGLKNFIQINATFSTLTGVPSTNQSVAVTFNEVKDQLPSNNSVKIFSSSAQVGISKLAASYCSALINDGNLRNQILPTFNFEAGVATALNESGENLLITELLNAFWASTSGLENKDSSVEVLKGLMKDLKEGLENAGANQTRNIAIGMCTAVLSSPNVNMM